MTQWFYLFIWANGESKCNVTNSKTYIPIGKWEMNGSTKIKIEICNVRWIYQHQRNKSNQQPFKRLLQNEFVFALVFSYDSILYYFIYSKCIQLR